MFGVVLWSDTEDQKAVIWCEDHGDLAFYRQLEGDHRVPLDAGDWVQFDMTTDRHLRLAHNPRLVSEGVCPDLPDKLNAAAPRAGFETGPAQPGRGSAEIIQFAIHHAARRLNSQGAAAHSA